MMAPSRSTTVKWSISCSSFSRGRRTRIPATVPGIDSDNDVSSGAVYLCGALDRLKRSLALQVNHEAVAVGRIRTRRERPRTHGRVQIENDAQLAICAQAAANAPNEPRTFRHAGKGLAEAALFEVDNEAARITECEDVVVHRLAQVEHHSSLVVLCPDTHIFDGRAGENGRTQYEQQRASCQSQSGHKRVRVAKTRGLCRMSIRISQRIPRVFTGKL